MTIQENVVGGVTQVQSNVRTLSWSKICHTADCWLGEEHRWVGKQSAGVTSRGLVSSYLLWCSPYCPARQHRGVVGPVREPIVSTTVCHEEEQLMWQIYWVSGRCSLLTCPCSSTTHNSHTPDSHTSEGLFSSIASCFWNNWLLWTLNNSCLLFPYAGKALGDGWSICLWTRRSTSNVCSTLDIFCRQLSWCQCNAQI